ncbi:MAG: ABC-F family ATP-binding cassette domain-containing protein, partial [Myxococcales bacterium]
LGSLDEKRTAIEEIRSVRGDMNADVARQYLARFRFYGDDALRTVAGFSGGERSRLALAKLLLEPRNLIFLDEPTNHLDIPAAEILEEALVGFEGTVILVSHDRRFLETVATRVVAVRDGEVTTFEGTFPDWREQQARQAEAARQAAESARSAASARSAPSAGKAAFEDARQAARAAERKKRRFKELEDLIAQGERQLAAHREALKQVPGDDWEELARRAEQEQALGRQVDEMMTEWSDLGSELDGAAS